MYTVQNTVPAAVNANKPLSAKITPCHSWLPVGGPSVLRGGGGRGGALLETPSQSLPKSELRICE
jgi:hypothetical protein